ncbi:uncharacterized protein METZ01_LOCUS350346 [marine metagenome]|uniref:Uncharacterized protein n=1 Tax=marine metagenome TaxID=408172 RepID=A0A382RJS0_9ZZZZ
MQSRLCLLFVLLLFFNIDVNSQCAMCKAVVETNLEAGGSIGAGLNTGILYLMAMPYISILLFGFFWYKQNKKSTIQ